MPSVATKHGQIHYRDYRHDNQKIPVILIHGAGSQTLDWSIEMRRDLGAIALDLPGHGKSPLPARTSIEGYAAAVISLLDTLELSKVIVIGHSMGGAIAQWIALEYPSYVKALVLIATASKFEVSKAILEGIIEHPQATAELIMKWSWASHVDEKIKQQGAKRLLETLTDVIQGDYLACRNFDVEDRLSTIEVDTLILAGEQDKMTPLAWNEKLAKGISNSTLKIFPDNGHMLHLENPIRTIEEIQNWLAQL